MVPDWISDPSLTPEEKQQRFSELEPVAASGPPAKSPPKRRWLIYAIVGILTLLLMAGGSIAYLNHRFSSNIDTTTFLPSTKSAPRPEALPQSRGAENILIMGSDTRAGNNGKNIGGETPGLSDTAILLHIGADRRFAYGVSIPRDSMIERPACPRKDGSGTDGGGLTQFNEAFAIGGVACTVATVEQNTQVPIDHFMVIDFAGFRSLIDDVGGVTMCVPAAVNDSIGHIHLRAGTYRMDGATALDYVRVRHGIGVDLGDIGRMKRQQAFLSALASQTLNSGLLTHPIALLKTLNTATKSLTVDPGLSNLRKLAGLAASLKNIGVQNIHFITVPFRLWPQDPNRVVWKQQQADKIWSAMIQDEMLPAKEKQASLTPANTSGVGVSTDPKRNVNGPSRNDRRVYGLC